MYLMIQEQMQLSLVIDILLSSAVVIHLQKPRNSPLNYLAIAEMLLQLGIGIIIIGADSIAIIHF